MKNILISALAILSLTACGLFTPEPVITKASDAKALVDSIVYVKAKNGLCFGVTGVGKLSTAGHYNESQMMVLVNCEAVGL